MTMRQRARRFKRFSLSFTFEDQDGSEALYQFDGWRDGDVGGVGFQIWRDERMGRTGYRDGQWADVESCLSDMLQAIGIEVQLPKPEEERWR